MLVSANPYHLPPIPDGTVIISNVPPHLMPPPEAIFKNYHNQKKRYNDETDALVQKALREAWEQYGPKRVKTENLPPGAWRLPQGQPPSTINSKNFQPITSEWDTEMSRIPMKNRKILQPGIFNHVLSKYIELEVNNHEIADFIRRLVFAFFVGIIVIGWICLGLAIGLIPFSIFGWSLGKRNLEGKVFSDSTKTDRDDSVRNDIMREITERVFLALDGDWLTKLEQKVKKGSTGRWLKTHVHCCIMPDAKAKGVAECQLIRKARKISSPFKCLSDLIYDIQFGPADSITTNSTRTKTT